MLDKGVEVVPIESIGSIAMEKFIFLFVRDLEKFRSCWMRGWKVFPMDSIGSIGQQ